MNTRCLFFIPFFKILFASTVFAFVPGDEVVLSFPPLKLQKNERIVGFEISVTTGHIIAVDRVPQDWSLNLEAEVSSKTTISGAAGHGAGALLTTSELPELTIRVNKPSIETGPLFSADATIRLTADFEKVRTSRLKQPDLILKKKGI